MKSGGQFTECLTITITLPRYLADYVQTTAQSSSHHGFRSADMHVKPCTRTKFGDRGFRSTRPAAWNSLPYELHHTDTDLFECRLKTVLLSRTNCR